MKKMKKIISILVAVVLVLTALPLSFISGTAASSQPDESLKLNRPMANLYVTPVTRVAYAANSMKAPSGNNSVIVKSTPSGMPYLSYGKTALAYGGETPVATQITFTPGVTLSEEPVLSCSNATVRWNNAVYSNGTYTWTVTGGTAVSGSVIVFNVSYTYSETNPITGKTYTNSYITSGTSYIEAIATPAGVFTTKRTYADYGLGTETMNRSYVASYILGQNAYGSILNSGEPDGSVAFGTSSWTVDSTGWTDEYGMMQSFSDSDATRNYNVGYKVDSNRPLVTVYFDTSVNSTLSDLNLRTIATNLTMSDESDERVTVSMNDFAVLSGNVATFEEGDDDFELSSDVDAKNQLNITKPTTSMYAIGGSLYSYFTGVGPGTENTTTDYTVAYQYKTSAGWNDVFVAHSYTLRVVTYNKGALRNLIENVQSIDPSVATTDISENGYKGYNPQSWYYSNGWENFINALNTARGYLEKPNVTQNEIDAQYNALKSAYNGLVMKTADYTSAGAYYNQAIRLNPNYYTYASWARLQTILDGYCSNYSVLYQPAVDKLSTDIKAAMDALEEREADYSAFIGHLTTINNLMRRAQSTYGKTADNVYEGWANVVSVLKKSGCTYNELDGYTVENYLLISSQATVDGYAMLLEGAINKLKLKGADYTEAKKAENAYKLIRLSYVTEDIAPNLTAAYNALVAVHGLDLTHQAEVDAATANLNMWLNRVTYKPANTSAAENLIAYTYTLDPSQYDNFSNVEAAIENLEAKLTLDIRYQSEVDRAVAALQSAIDRLLTHSADYSSVDAALEAVADREREILETYEDTYGFTAAAFYSNWSVVMSAVGSVVRGLDINQQTIVDGFASAINTAMNNLQENTADYSRVSALQNTAYDLITNGSSLYTQNSLNNLLDVYINVQGNLPISRQAEVDAFEQAIQQAIDSLEYLPANYANVNSQINTANGKIAADEAFSQAHPGYTLYTSESIAEVSVAIAAVVDGLDIRYQTTVDGYASDIQAAVANLEYGPADYTAVSEALSAVPEDLSVYTTLTVTTLNTTLNSIVYTYNADRQSTVDNYVTKINNAIGKLKYKTADYTAVNSALRLVPSDSSVYTEDSWQAVQDTVNAVVTGLDITHQDEVDAMAANLRNALGFLAYKSADYSAVDAAKEDIPSDLSVYSEESVAALNAVLDSIDYYCNINQQAVVDGYAASLNSAIQGLSIKSADYSAVESAVEAANEKINSGLYTDESVAAVQSAINAITYNLDITHQEEVSAMAQAVAENAEAMTYKPADYTELNESAEDAENEISKAYYTDESVAALQAELDRIVYNLDITHQSEIDKLTEDIVKATKELTLKPADYTELQNILNLLDNSTSEIYNIPYSNFNEVMSLIADYRTQTVENNMNLTVDRQSEVDAMCDILQGYIDSLIPAANEFFELTGTAAVKDGEYLIGLEQGLTKAAFERSFCNYENVTLTYSNMAVRRTIGTGTVITVTSDSDPSNVIAEYTVLIFGDIDGDGYIDVNDLKIAGAACSGAIAKLEGAQEKAADITGRRAGFDEADVEVLTEILRGTLVIDQTAGKV